MNRTGKIYAIKVRERGIALILVLWVIVLLTVIAASMAMTQRSSVTMTSNTRLERQGRALANAGINFMALQLVQRNLPVEQLDWPVDGRTREWEFAGSKVWIGAMPDSSRINLNLADETLLLGLLESSGLDEEQAERVRDAILDWRDKDNEHRLQGAEDPDYEDLDRPVGARDAVFESVEELQQVMGITAEIYKKIAAALTVHSGQRTVNPVFASSTVLSAIPGMTQEDVDEYIQQREDAYEQGAPAPLPAISDKSMAKSDGTVFRVFAETDLPEGGRVQAEVIVDITKKTQKGYKVLERNYSPLVTLGRATASAQDGMNK